MGTPEFAIHGDGSRAFKSSAHPSGRLMRAAIIGTGGIARVHARLIRELGGELVGVCGRTLQSAQPFGAATLTTTRKAAA